ncbi:MAG: P-loop NTPase [Candidatus Nanohaloarchaea archaeon]|nr:P-loop NTPase [Candidatus Nanohaloarchaea archaeon]
MLRGDAHITEATYIHNSGLRVVPAGLSVDDLKETSPHLVKDALQGTMEDSDIMLIDSAAGLGSESVHAIEASDELLIVTNPNLPAVTDALKTANLAEEAGTHVLGVVLNRVEDEDHELSMEEVEEMIGHPVVSKIPEHRVMKDAVSSKTPVIHQNPDHHVSDRFRQLAADVAGIEYEPPERGLFARLRRMLR